MKTNMLRFMITVAACAFVLTGVFTGLYFGTHAAALLSLSITFGTISYHLFFRLLVGLLFNKTMNNHADYHRPWYQQKPWEARLYERLGVKKWKASMPTFNSDVFDPRQHTWDEIAQAMCQAELVHEVNIPLSFLPLAAVPLFGSFWVFLLTSLAAAAFDLLFVMMQRYNRPRIVRIADRYLQKK